MRERTGKTQAQWDEFVRDLQENGCPWDWSKVEVKQRPVRREQLAKAGVFAVGETKDRDVVFIGGDVIGPLGGVIRRFSRYEQLYYPDQKWVLHDPACYEVSLRAQ